MTVKCHDFFGCKEERCIMFTEEEKSCWEVDPVLTPCIAKSAEPINMENKIVFCKNCLYFLYLHKN
ncbi:MAG: hypothetical protein KKG47_04420 [Proteobacteria bacterium]|nr:hypothetical protein [Pseudomonadota bacterium]MBU1739876.1 hypothetical protein [Pseudomonadota bacterium]